MKVLRFLTKSTILAQSIQRPIYAGSAKFSGHQQGRNENSNQTKWAFAALATGALSFAAYRHYMENQPLLNAKEEVSTKKIVPVYTSKDVSSHDSMQTGIWVSYKDSVYDITNFVENHPGGDKILLGAGKAIDPFWNLYAVHKKDEVYEMLETYKIGKLNPDDQISEKDMNDPFVNDPKRYPVFRINSAKPFNAEPPLEVLSDSFITPNDLFYVRNHLPVPVVDPKSYRLEISTGNKSVKLSLDDLRKKFKWASVTTTMQCAGNRREEMSNYKPVKGLSWGPSAIGTATWSGPRLKDVLEYAGFKGDAKIQHVHFDGLDQDITKSCYGASIPVTKAMSSDGDVLLALNMNGEDIPRDHGYPVRAVVPGVVGARNVKWVHRVATSDSESDSHWQQKDYKCFSPSTTYDNANYSKAYSIQDMPVTSVICAPADDSAMTIEADGTIPVRGYAWSGGGRGIIRVDVSPDGGNTWVEAGLQKKTIKDDSAKEWSWSLWEVDLPVKAGQTVNVTCKAVDSSYTSQPETMKGIWNMRGFLGNAWYRVKVKVEEEEE